jgi:hypothetical protein
LLLQMFGWLDQNAGQKSESIYFDSDEPKVFSFLSARLVNNSGSSSSWKDAGRGISSRQSYQRDGPLSASVRRGRTRETDLPGRSGSKANIPGQLSVECRYQFASKVNSELSWKIRRPGRSTKENESRASSSFARNHQHLRTQPSSRTSASASLRVPLDLRLITHLSLPFFV